MARPTRTRTCPTRLAVAQEPVAQGNCLLIPAQMGTARPGFLSGFGQLRRQSTRPPRVAIPGSCGFPDCKPTSPV